MSESLRVKEKKQKRCSCVSMVKKFDENIRLLKTNMRQNIRNRICTDTVGLIMFEKMDRKV